MTIDPRCDCQNPDGPPGVRHISMECPVHNENPYVAEEEQGDRVLALTAPQAAPAPPPHVLAACRKIVASARRMCVDDVTDVEAEELWEAVWRRPNQ